MHGSSSSPRLSLSRLRLPGSVVRVLYDVVPGARETVVCCGRRAQARICEAHKAQAGRGAIDQQGAQESRAVVQDTIFRDTPPVPGIGEEVVPS